MDYAIIFGVGFAFAWGIQQFRLNGAKADLTRLTDRDAKGRYVKR